MTSAGESLDTQVLETPELREIQLQEHASGSEQISAVVEAPASHLTTSLSRNVPPRHHTHGMQHRTASSSADRSESACSQSAMAQSPRPGSRPVASHFLRLGRALIPRAADRSTLAQIGRKLMRKNAADDCNVDASLVEEFNAPSTPERDIHHRRYRVRRGGVPGPPVAAAPRIPSSGPSRRRAGISNRRESPHGRLRPLSAQRRRIMGQMQRSSNNTAGPSRFRRQSSAQEARPGEDRCYAYCLADRVDLQNLQRSWLEDLHRRSTAIAAQVAASAASRARPSEVAASNSYNAQHIESNFTQNMQVVPLNKDIMLLKIGRKDCFVFGFGCLVCWGCSPQEAKKAKTTLSTFLVKPLAAQDIDEDNLDITNKTGDIFLSCQEPPTFERVALAYALAQSVRLGSLEIRIDRSIAQTRSIPDTMARSGHVSLSSEGVTRMMGALLVLRHQVNLETDILDTPEFFWDYDTYEPLYLSCRHHLELDRRVSILNQRFEVLQDLFDALEGELNERHGNRLEWVVIFLCAFEALVMSVRVYTRFFAADLHQKASETHHVVFLPILGPLGLVCHTLVLEPARILVTWMCSPFQ